MKTHILRNFITGKLLAVGCLTSTLLFLSTGSANAQSVSFGLEFGMPQTNNGPCIGRGGCEQVFDIDATTNTYASSQSAITVTFQVPIVTIVIPPPPVSFTDTVSTAQINIDSIVPVSNPDTTTAPSNVILMSFSLSELTNKQPDQVAYFTDASHTYQFGAPYSLTDPIFAPLRLLPGAYVDPTDETNVTINGDQVVVTIYYSYSAGKMAGTIANAQTAKCTLIPNPASDVVTLTPNDARINRYNIINLVGQVVSSDVITGTSKSVDVSSLPAGMYMVNVFSGNTKMETIKFAKQ